MSVAHVRDEEFISTSRWGLGRSPISREGMMQLTKVDILKEIKSWGKCLVFAMVFSLLLTQFIIVNAKVPTGSMQNSIMPNDRVVASRLSYIRSDPERFDIVVFRSPNDNRTLYVKRVIGLPGETVKIEAGRVFINGDPTPLYDSFVPTEPFEEYFEPVTVPEGSYYVLGDNRNYSADSRTWNNMFVPGDDILGRVVFRYFPNISLF